MTVQSWTLSEHELQSSPLPGLQCAFAQAKRTRRITPQSPACVSMLLFVCGCCVHCCSHCAVVLGSPAVFRKLKVKSLHGQHQDVLPKRVVEVLGITSGNFQSIQSSVLDSRYVMMSVCVVHLTTVHNLLVHAVVNDVYHR